MEAVLIDGTEYGAELKTLVSAKWLETALGCKPVNLERSMDGFNITAIVGVIEDNESIGKELVVAYPELCDEKMRTILLYLQGLAALINPRIIVVAPLVEARCENMEQVAALGKAYGLTEGRMKACRDYPISDTTSQSLPKMTWKPSA